MDLGCRVPVPTTQLKYWKTVKNVQKLSINRENQLFGFQNLTSVRFGFQKKSETDIVIGFHTVRHNTVNGRR